MQTNTGRDEPLKDDDGINFRPSPNFKHMKKYLKSKFEESGGSSPGATERATVEASEQRGGAERGVQPPLPPHPPPPDTPPPPAAVKTELEDDEGFDEGLMCRQMARGERIMCRQFARGACTRGDACIYAHEIILSQLHGIYTFCKNYQNPAGCNLPKCKFVHATVFEKEYFYRSGYLPPHALAHIEDANSHPREGAGSQQSQGAGSSCGPPAVAVPGAVGVGAVAEAGLAAVHKRNIEQLAPRDAVLAESIHKKCKNCEVKESRLQELKQQVEGLLRTNDEVNKKMAVINLKHNKLNCVIGALMKTSPPAAPPPPLPVGNGTGSGARLPTINVRNEKEINGLVDPLKIRLTPHNLMALVRLLTKGEPPAHPHPGPDGR